MDYLLKKLSNIQKDKLLHFFWGAILSFTLMLPFGIFGMFIALIIPAIKELYYIMISILGKVIVTGQTIFIQLLQQ